MYLFSRCPFRDVSLHNHSSDLLVTNCPDRLLPSFYLSITHEFVIHTPDYLYTQKKKKKRKEKKKEHTDALLKVLVLGRFPFTFALLDSLSEGEGTQLDVHF